MADGPVVVSARGAVTTIALNRPRALNALDRDLTLALREAVFAAEHDPAVRCLVIRGGEHFMAGGAQPLARAHARVAASGGGRVLRRERRRARLRRRAARLPREAQAGLAPLSA
jgi:enoyl-CoA hydratase/carnithine racemase